MRRAARSPWRTALTRLSDPGTALALAVALVAPGHAQEIVRSDVLERPALEVQVTVAGALPSDRVQCLLRDAAGQVRVASASPVGMGTTAGRATILSIPLPRLTPAERDYAVSLVRADRELDRTVWRPLPPHP
jgi:hypothetical protein